jgi:hypothetical protein
MPAVEKAEENDKEARPVSILDILIEFGQDSTIQGLSYIFYSYQGPML